MRSNKLGGLPKQLAGVALAVLLAAVGLGARDAQAAVAPAPGAGTGTGLRAWVQASQDWAVVRYQAFSEKSLALASLIESACAAEPSSARLTALQTQWVDTMLVWRDLEALQLGPTLKRRSSKTIDFWPTRPSAIESAVEFTASAPVSGPQADEAMVRWGTAVKGLPALEWFLFPEAIEKPALWRSPAHCLFARRISLSLSAEATLLHGLWKQEATRWPTASAEELSLAVRDTLNLLVGSIELLRGKKLQKGARIASHGGPEGRLNLAFDSTRSRDTKRFLMVHFEAMAKLLVGRKSGLDYARGGPTLGLADALRAEGFPGLAASLPPAVNRAHRALAALPSDPAKWTLANTEPAANTLRDLRAAIDPPVAKAMRVTITFTDADGD